MKTQLQFDFNRSAQLRFLDDLDLSTNPHGRRIKQILRSIDSAAQGGQYVRVSERRLSEIAGCSVRTVRRAIADAESAELLTVTRSTYESTYYLNWSVIIDWKDRSSNQQISDVVTKKDSSKQQSSNGGWPIKLDAESLTKPETVESLFRYALERTWVNESDQLRFFTLAASCVRRSKENQIRSIGAAFTASVKRAATGQPWTWGSDVDETHARKSIAQLNRRNANIKSLSPVSAIGIGDYDDAKVSREDQMKQLKQRFALR